MTGRHTEPMTTYRKQITVTFTIPNEWDASEFLNELSGAYFDADREAAERVEIFVVGDVVGDIKVEA